MNDDNISRLEAVMESEATLLLTLINKLDGDDLYMFIRAVADLRGLPHDSDAMAVVNVARNVKNIEAAIDEFYVTRS